MRIQYGKHREKSTLYKKITHLTPRVKNGRVLLEKIRDNVKQPPNATKIAKIIEYEDVNYSFLYSIA